jgi:hypothetical protein
MALALLEKEGKKQPIKYGLDHGKKYLKREL